MWNQVSFPQFPFRAQDVSQQLRRQLDEELAALQADIVDQIEVWRVGCLLVVCCL
jgi:hypothetical protein